MKKKTSSESSSNSGGRDGSSSSYANAGHTKRNNSSSDEMMKDVANRFVKQPFEGFVNGMSNVVEKGWTTISPASSGTMIKKNRRGASAASSSTNKSPSLQGTSPSSPSSSSIPATTETGATIKNDETLQNMQIVLENQSLKQVSIHEFYEACFGSESDMYESWINSYGDKYNIQITPWECDEEYKNEWNNEIFPQRRIITYSYDRDPSTLGYSLGEPTVHVTQIQYFSQSATRGILSVEMKMVGEVCANCFHVQIRGVATQINNGCDIQVDFGVFCVFTKQTLIGGKIRDITRDTTQSQMIDMFAMIQKYCGQQQQNQGQQQDGTTTTTTMNKTPSIAATTVSDVEEEQERDDKTNDTTSCWQQLTLCDPFKTNKEKQDQHMDDIDLELQAIDKKYRSICELHLVVVDPSRPQLPPSEINFIKNEFDIAKESLNHILVRDIQAEKHIASEAAAESTITSTTANSSGDSRSSSTSSLLGRHLPFNKKKMTTFRERMIVVPSMDSVGLTTNTLFNKVAALSATAAENIVPAKLTETTKATGLSSIGGNPKPVVDTTINGMNVLIKDTIEDTSLDEFYKAIYNNQIFLHTLQNSGKFNIQVEPWHHISKGSDDDHKKEKNELLVDSWNGERYHMKRNYSFDYRLYNNKSNDILTLAHLRRNNNGEDEREDEHTSTASRTMFARKDGNSKVVMHIRDDGSSSFSSSCEVIVRWVVTPIVDNKTKNKNGHSERNRLLVKIGQFVVLKNHSILARKFRSEATRYNMHAQRLVLKEFKVVLGANQNAGIVGTDSLLQEARLLSDENALLLGETSSVNNDIPCFSFRQCFPFSLCETRSRFLEGTIIASNDDLVNWATNLERKLKAVHAILESDRKFADSAEDLHFYLSQLFIVRESLDNILQTYSTHDEKPLEEVRNHSNGFL